MAANSTYILTNDALSKILDSYQTEGRFVFLHSFRVASTAGSLAASRSLSNINQTWYSGNISSRINSFPNHITAICTLPQDASNIVQDVKEVYLIGSDNSGFTSNLSVLANGTASASTGTANNAFDNNAGTTWTASTAVNEWVKFAFTHPKVVTKIGITPAVNGTSNVIINDLTLQGSNDNSTWSTLYTGNMADSNVEQNFAFGNSTSYTYYRVSFTSSRNGINALALKDVKLYESLNQQLFLFAVGQPSSLTQFVPGAALSFRVQFDMIQNQDTVTWNYTQATEISEHDSNPYAHPDITSCLHDLGAAILPYQKSYQGQFFDLYPTWSVTQVPTNDSIVYKNTDGYSMAIADGTSASNVVGLAKRTTSSTWAANTAKSLGAYVTPTNSNNYYYECISAGTTGATSADEPCSGSGCLVNIAVNGSGNITSVTVGSSGGTSYKVGQVLKINGGIGGKITIATLSGTAVATFDNGTLVPGSQYSAATDAGTTAKKAWPVIVNNVVQDGSVTWVCRSAIRDKIITSGLIQLTSGSTNYTTANATSIGAALYLSNTSNGSLTATPGSIKVGRHLGSGLIQFSSFGSMTYATGPILKDVAVADWTVGVADKDVVYFNTGTSKYAKAIADGSAAQYAIGIADVTNNRVFIFGYVNGLMTGLSSGSPYYLSPTVAGTLQTGVSPVFVGVAKSATDIFLDIDQIRSDALHSQIYYVGKHGNDSNDGRTLGSAKLTFGATITAAVTLTPSATNKFTITCLDAGVYTENITCAQWVDIYAPSATLAGTITMASDSGVVLQTIKNTTGNTITKATSGDSRLQVESIDDTGKAANTNPIVCSSGALHLDAHIILPYLTNSPLVVSSTAEVYGQVGVMKLNTGASYAVYVSNSYAGTINLIINEIEQAGTGGYVIYSGTTVTGVVNLIVNSSQTTNAYSIASGTINLTANRLSVTNRTVTGGTVNITVAQDLKRWQRVFYFSGLAVTGIFLDGWYPEKSISIDKITLMARGTPVGADLIMKVTKAGSDETMSSYPTLTAGNTYQSTTFTAKTYATTDRLGFDITQIGSTYAGSDLTIIVDGYASVTS